MGDQRSTDAPKCCERVPWCDEHSPTKSGSFGSCLACECRELTRALSEIDAALVPNYDPMQGSYFEVDYNPAGVVDRVKRHLRGEFFPCPRSAEMTCQEDPSRDWRCECGHLNLRPFCEECGRDYPRTDGGPGSGEPSVGSRLWRCEHELKKARAELQRLHWLRDVVGVDIELMFARAQKEKDGRAQRGERAPEKEEERRFPPYSDVDYGSVEGLRTIAERGHPLYYVTAGTAALHALLAERDAIPSLVEHARREERDRCVKVCREIARVAKGKPARMTAASHCAREILRTSNLPTDSLSPDPDGKTWARTGREGHGHGPHAAEDPLGRNPCDGHGPNWTCSNCPRSAEASKRGADAATVDAFRVIVEEAFPEAGDLAWSTAIEELIKLWDRRERALLILVEGSQNESARSVPKGEKESKI